MENSALAKIEGLLGVARYQDAIRECHQQLASNPDQEMFLIPLVRAHFGNEDFQRANQIAQRLIKLDPESPIGYYFASIASFNLKDFDRELQFAEEAARLVPDNTAFLQRLTEAQLQSGLLKRANETCEQLVKLDPGSEEAHELMGDISLKIDRVHEAETHYRAALRINPEAIHLLNNLAITLRAQKRTEDAIELLFNALKLKPTNESLQHNLFEFIKSYLDSKTMKGGRTKALESLPAPVQAFYRDYKGRTTIFRRYSNFVLVLFWIALIGALAWLLN